MLMFSYWDRPDQSPIADFVAEWRRHFPGFRILGDPDIEPMLDEDFPEYVSIFRNIRIPTCKSDIALLMALYRLGGLFVDCHCGIRDVGGVSALLEDSVNWEIILYNASYQKRPRPTNVLRPLNSVMVVQRHSPIIRETAALALRNLESHWRAEQQCSRHVFYDIWSLTGPGVLEHTICIPSPEMWGPPLSLRPENVGRVRFMQEGPDAPIRRGRHTSYKTPETHWSQRQKRERLFFDHSSSVQDAS